MRQSTRRAFSLVELLVVISIIVLLIGILIPALSGARNAARNAQTQQAMTDVNNAIGVYRQDNNGATPGLANVRDMGASDNLTEGMSAMENLLLGLAGENAVLGSVDEVNNNSDLRDQLNQSQDAYIEVGPSQEDTKRFYIRPDLLGDTSGYYAAPEKLFAVQLNGEDDGNVAQYSASTVNSNAAASETDLQMPDLIDAHGQPILAWVADEFAPRSINFSNSAQLDPMRQFAAHTSDDGGSPNSGISKYYWASNAAFLRANVLGRKGNDQTLADGKTSSLGFGMDEDDRLDTLAGLLGNPSFPVFPSPNLNLDSAPLAQIYPGSGIGTVILQSAGSDGFYAGTADGGFGVADNNRLLFGLSFKTADDKESRYRDDTGAYEQIDLREPFDDIFVSNQ